MQGQLGKFEVLGPLGRGAQSVVWLARDPDLDREVAIKLLRLQGEPAQRQRLMQEARTVSQLRHPLIVPIYSAGEHQGDPFLVFERVQGRTLAAELKAVGRLDGARAATLMIDVLDALDHAHRAGVVHRDLKPSNIMVDAQDRARVMDFGIATRVGDASGAGLLGTPRYLAPEYVRDQVVAPSNDVFAAGLILYELLTGRPAIGGEGVFQQLHQIAHEPLRYEAGEVERIDEALLEIIARATAKDPLLRLASAAQMRDALRRYLAPETVEAAAGAKSATLDFLLRRLQHRSDFPAMSHAVGAINRIALSQEASAGSLANAILKDFALTNKVLRVANSAFYRGGESGRVTTVSRAIVILGFDAVRNLALSLVMFDRIRDPQQAEALKQEFLRANLRALLASQLAGACGISDGEEVFICALFHRLGRLLAISYLPEEAQMIDRLCQHEGCSDDQAALRVLGLSYERLGMGVAEHWGLPARISRAMRRSGRDHPTTPAGLDEQITLLSAAADELQQTLERQPPEELGPALRTLSKRYGRVFSLDERQLGVICEAASDRLTTLARALGMPDRLVPTAPSSRPVPVPAPPSSVAGLSLPEEGSLTDSSSVLAAGIQEISQALVEDGASADLLRGIAEVIYRGLSAELVLFAVREPGGSIAASSGFGAGLDAALRHFRIRLGQSDLFNLLLARQVDLHIADTADPKVARHLPPWMTQPLALRSFVALPLIHRGQPQALLFAGHAQPGGIQVPPQTLALLRTLRNQALLALNRRD
ncbi:MAG TPA: HDOD domain-containing protein [Nevskiaceae bacterium]|nr:HDOD domain-containing protein [Nevskiaceae bacterium]